MRGNTVYVLDAAALFSSYQLSLPPGAIAVTTRYIADEVRDDDSRRALEISLAGGKLTIAEPTEDAVNEAVRLAREMGELSRLSYADISLIALTIKYIRAGSSVIVITDDYSVQNVVRYLGAEVLGVKRRIITKVAKYVIACPVCGYVGHSDYCPICGSRMVRKPQSWRAQSSSKDGAVRAF